MNFWFDRKFKKRKDDKGKSFNPLDRQLKEKFNQRLKLKEYKIMCNSKSKSPCFGTLE